MVTNNSPTEGNQPAEYFKEAPVTRIIGTLRPGATLFVAATHAEALALPDTAPLLITGIGTTRATTELTMLLTRAQAAAGLPGRIVNIGTAGSLAGSTGIFEISHVHRHDSSELCPQAIDLPAATTLPAARLTTGDSFIGDAATRDRLAADADLVDMEGHALAFVAQRFGVPITLIKQVSDHADNPSSVAWEDAARRGAEELARVAMEFFG